MKQRTKPEPQSLKMLEVGEILNCSKSTVKRRLDEGLLTGYDDGGCIKIYRWSVEAYLATRQPVGGGAR